MKILLIDDHTLFRQGLIFLLRELANDLQISEAADCASAIALPVTDFELVLLDLHMPGLAGLDALTAISRHFASSNVVVLSGDENPELVRQTFENGAVGFIPKSASPAILIGALRLVLAGAVYLPPIALRDLRLALGTEPSEPSEQSGKSEPREKSAKAPLTAKQLDILMRAITGRSNKLIARELAISEGTVKAHLSAAFRILGVNNRTQAVHVVSQFGVPDTAGSVPFR